MLGLLLIQLEMQRKLALGWIFSSIKAFKMITKVSFTHHCTIK
jgi:hypothetical protein